MSDKKPSPQIIKEMTKLAPRNDADNKPVPEKPENKAPDDEKGGFKDSGLPEPTRYNDWEVKGRCSDF